MRMPATVPERVLEAVGTMSPNFLAQRQSLLTPKPLKKSVPMRTSVGSGVVMPLGCMVPLGQTPPGVMPLVDVGIMPKPNWYGQAVPPVNTNSDGVKSYI